jgi:7-cyano-7-deazaguanine reductase
MKGRDVSIVPMKKPASTPRKATPALNQRQAPAVPPSAPSKDLQVFPNPQTARDYVIRFDVPEFTCHCPLTGQPDFAHFWIEIVPDQLCVETKSLKQYFWSFRNEGAFHERVTNTIVDDLVKAIRPRFIRIHADWLVRGGIRTYVTAEHRKKGWKPPVPVSLPAASASGEDWARL